MRDDDLHPSHQDLLLAADGELPEHRAAEIRTHLAACWQCRARTSEIESTIRDFMRAHTRATNREVPPAAGPRALLRSRVAESRAASSHVGRRMLPLVFSVPALACLSAVALAIAMGSGFLFHGPAERESKDVTLTDVLPNPQLTPGVTRQVALSDLCSAQDGEVVRSVPGTLERQVLNEYGVSTARAGDYEVDYLITPGLGGADDIRNMWPEPHSDAVWNSFVKDQLEERLHHLVCSGQVDLATAQRQIASNWIAAYKQYFGTDRPVAETRVELFEASVLSQKYAYKSGRRWPGFRRRFWSRRRV